MPTPFDAWTIKDAQEALAEANKGDSLGPKAQQYYEGDHWDSSLGWIGQRPASTDPNLPEIMREIEQAFVFENAIKAVVDRHTGGVLGREPTFALSPRRALADGEAPSTQEDALGQLGEAALTSEWWDKRKVMQTLRRATNYALLRGRSVLRLYLPAGLREAGGTVSVFVRDGEEPIFGALRLVHLDALSPEVACVTEDEATKREVAIYAYKDEGGKEWVELSYLSEDEMATILRVLGGAGEDIQTPMELGGRLTMHQVEREPLVTGGVMQLQRVINHTRTIISRNVHMAGFRQQAYLNAQPPGSWRDDGGNEVDPGTPGAKWVTGTLPRGAGATQFVQGNPIYGPEGTLTGYTSASSVVTDPVDPTGLITVRDSSLDALLHEVHQRHVMMSGDASASGESRKQARAEYEADLGLTALTLNDGGRWLIEATLSLGSFLSGGIGQFSIMRPEFAVRVDAGPVSADEKKENRADFEAGLLSREGAMAANGVADVAAETARIDAEDELRQEKEDASLTRISGTLAPTAPTDDDSLDDESAA